MKDKGRKRSKLDESDKTDARDEPKTKKRKSAVKEHKETLESLKKSDPKFYEFLQQQDAELLDFDVSDAEDENEEEGGDEDVNEDQEEPEEDEEEGPYDEEEEGPLSDEDEQEAQSVDDDDEGASAKISITSKLIRKWQKQLSKVLEAPEKVESRKVGSLLEQIVDAFRAVVTQTGARPDKRGPYRIDDSVGFNGVVRLCFTAFPALWQRLAGADSAAVSQGKQKRLRPYAKPYLHNIAEFLQEIQNADVLVAVLKHLTHIADYYSLFGALSRRAVKVLIDIWSTRDENARVLAFISIMKLARGTPDPLVAIVLKKMYLSYVKNTKLVTPASWPLISFMQKSYAEVCGLDKQLSYQHAFIYVRQLAIHLRNAITTKKKEQIMAIHNWQFVQCLYLWARVLSVHAQNEIMKPLVYPLIQVALGCARLIPTAKYFPLRFHCVRAILILAQESNVYVPVLPVVLEVFQQIDVKKKHLRQSLKPLDFDCLLKLSQSQLQESGFKVGVVEAALELIVETMKVHAHSVAFPELAFACCSRLKAFYKSCHIAALSRPVKELSDKISEHSSWLEQHRTAATLNLSKGGSVNQFESGIINADDSPLRKYFEIFKAMKERERKLKLETAGDAQAQDVALEDETEDDEPTKQKAQGKKEKSRVKKEKVVKRSSKKPGKKGEETFGDDVVQDLNLSDLDE